jgi:hypothetical protein
MSAPSTPLLNQPIGGIKIVDNTPILSFTMADANASTIVFEIELDTHNPIIPSSSDYHKFESRNVQGVWQYFNGTDYIDLPPVGIAPSANQDYLFTVPIALRNAIWYWKVSASDNVSCCKFNEGYFNQKKFCAGV